MDTGPYSENYVDDLIAGLDKLKADNARLREMLKALVETAEDVAVVGSGGPHNPVWAALAAARKELGDE